MQRYCREQLFGLRNKIMHRFEMFVENNYHLLYELELLKNYLPNNVALGDLSSHRKFQEYCPSSAHTLEAVDKPPRVPNTVTCLQIFDTINNWLEKSLNTPACPLPSNIRGVKYFFHSLGAIDPTVFFSGIANTKLWFLYDLPRLLTLCTNILYHYNDVSFITLLCTAEGFLDLWSILKLNKPIRQKLGKLGVPAEWAPVFQIFSVLQILMRSYPGESLHTFKFAFDLTLERMDFLLADPKEFEILEILGAGADGVVRKMRYRGKLYAIKSIHPLFDRDPKLQQKNIKSMNPKDAVGLEYMKRIDYLATHQPKDDFWQWLYSQLGEYISMLALPRPGFVKLYYCFIGPHPKPPKFYCPHCFVSKYDDVLDENSSCATCGTKLTETFYGNDSLHLVTEYCPLGSLRSYLDEQLIPPQDFSLTALDCVHLGTSLPEPQIVSFLSQLLSALAYHHARGVVHEDLKPDNILMRDKDTLCLGDFGLASFSRAQGAIHHGSPDYNPPEINSGKELPPDYDPAKKDVWAIGCIALATLGFYIPVKNIPKALTILKEEQCISQPLYNAIEMMLRENPVERGGALQCLIQLDGYGRNDNATSESSRQKREEGTSVEPSLEHMAEIMQKYHLLEYSDQTVPMMTMGNAGKKTLHIFRDYTRGITMCCKVYQQLLLSDSPRIQTLACTHLARIVANDHFRPLIVELGIVAKLRDALRHWAANPLDGEDLPLRITDMFYILTEITASGGCKQVVEEIIKCHVLPTLLALLPISKSDLLRTAIQIVFEQCLRSGIPADYFSQKLAPALWDLVLKSNSLRDKSIAVSTLALSLLSFPQADFSAHILALMDLLHASSCAVDRLDAFSKFCHTTPDEPVSPLRRYCKLLSSFNGELEQFAKSGSNAALLRDVWVDLIARSKNFVDLHNLLKSLISSCKAIISFYSKAKFPLVVCSACKAKVINTLFHCPICSDVYLCRQCFQTRELKAEKCYYKHTLDHYKVMTSVSRGKNTAVMSKLTLYSPKLVLKDSFMNPQRCMRAIRCINPACNAVQGIRVDGCSLVYCTKCRHRFCVTCHAPWKTPSPQAISSTDEEQQSEKMMYILFKYVESVSQDLTAEADASIRNRRPRSKSHEPSLRSTTTIIPACTHALFPVDDMFDLPTRCSYCNKILDGLNMSVVVGQCGHILCGSCSKAHARRCISSANLMIFSDGAFGLGCPVSGCTTSGLINDPHLIKQLISPLYYSLYLYVAVLLNEKKTPPFATCKLCGRNGVLDEQNRLLCECSATEEDGKKPFKKVLEMEGWLEKKSSGVVPHWQRRYFVLKGGVLSHTHQPLYIYPSQRAKVVCKMGEAGVVDKKSGKNATVKLEDGVRGTGHRQFYFSLILPGGSRYFLCADTLPEKEEWMNALRNWCT